MTEEGVNELVAHVRSKFNGRDPVAELGAFIENASLEELKQIVMLSANKIGEALAQDNEYKSLYQQALGVNVGADLLLSSYKFLMYQNATTELAPNVHGDN